ncbi:MAG: N-6 DNA methylase [Methanosarcinaceae archaeon]|nr:N-6 DNA methylase [Methanosarcinaceae archaeon]
MLDSTVKQQINNARDILVGKIPDPKGQIDQITNALIYKFMDDQDRLALTLPGGKETFFVNELKPYAWHKLFDSKLSNQEKADLYIEGIHKLSKAKHLPELFRDIFKDAFLPFRAPDTIAMFLGEINKFDYKHSENLGNAFEYLLSFLSVQGDLGSFRTPRNIIEFIVDAVDPQKEDTILDPACGTAGFLIEAYKHITQDNKLSPNEIQGLAKNIHGIEIDPGMAKIARVNLYLHGFKTPHITEDDTLSNENLWGKKYDVILANPPFMSPKGGIVPHDKFGVNSKRAEVLFTDYIAEHLKLGGRAGVVVPEGVIFQSGTAYKQLRKMLIENNYLWAVVSLPAGVFNPYSGVKTSILLFDRVRAEKNKEIMFFQVNNDGYSLGAQRREIKKNDLPEALEVVNKWKEDKKIVSTNVLYIGKDKIRETEEYKLSIDNYKETVDYSNVKWPMVELGEICNITTGRKDANEAEKDGLYPFFTCGKEILSINKYSFDSEAILIAGNGDVGATKYYNGKFDAYQRTYVLNNFKESLPKYVYYILKETLQNYLFPKKLGNTMPYIKLGMLQKYKIPLPPLNIQIKLVEEIERYQNIIDGAEKIINNWKPSFDIDPEWEKIKISEIAKLKYGIGEAAQESGEFRYIRITDINKYGELKGEDKKFIKETADSKKYLLKKGDVLVARTGATFGKTLYFDSDEKSAFAGFLIKFDFDEKKVLSKYFWYFAQSEHYWDQARLLMTGGGQPQFNASAVGKISVPLPSLKNQKQIVEKIEEERKLINLTQRLIEINKEKIKSVIDKIWI